MIMNTWRRDVSEAALTTFLHEDMEFPEENAVKLAQTLLELSEPEFGEDDLLV
jgi:hypothetical protein